MKQLIINLSDSEYNDLRNLYRLGLVTPTYKTFIEKICVEAIANGIPYDKVIDEVTELLETEWGYKGMKDDVARIMRGGAE